MSTSRFKNFRSLSPQLADSIPEDQWVDLIRTGSRSVFEQLFRSYYSRLCRYAYRLVGSRDAAEDLVQNVFLNIWKNRESWNPQSLPVVYLYRATRNQVINYAKHRKIRGDSFGHEVETRFVDDQTPESQYLQNECVSSVRETIARLPDRCRQIFLMKKDDGLKYSEIAAILGISVKTVETQMSRALRHLREKLAEYT